MKIRWMLDSAVMILLCAGCSSNGTVGTLADLLPLFTAGNVPQDGPFEDLNLGDHFGWKSDQVTDPSWPGEGLARYPMI